MDRNFSEKCSNFPIVKKIKKKKKGKGALQKNNFGILSEKISSENHMYNFSSILIQKSNLVCKFNETVVSMS